MLAGTRIAAEFPEAVKRPRRTLPRRSWPIVAVLLAMTGPLVVAATSVYLLSAVRAYVTGESLYSKGQKDAQIYLLEWVESQREADYRKLMDALAVPIAHRRAREAMQRSEPDAAVARQALIEGGNHPDDVDGPIRLFIWFGKTPLMAPAIQVWTDGDAAVEQMRGLVERARAQVRAGRGDAEALREIRIEAPELNRRLTALTSDFSAKLAEAGRRVQALLLGANAALALALAISGSIFVRRVQRRQAATEAELKRRQDSLQLLLDSAAEGLFGVDVDGRCTFVNRAALRMLGYTRETDLLDRPILETISAGRHDAGAADDGDALHSDAEMYLRRDGSAFPVERWSHPILHDGRVHGAVTTFFDISERLRLRRELRQEQILMERLVGAVTDAVITFGEDRRIRVFNAAAEGVLLIPAELALGRSVDGFFDPPLSAADATTTAGALFEVAGVRADGTQVPLEASFSRLETDDAVLHTVVLRDITAREAALAERRARESLEATNLAKTRFLSRMSHELRTPLNAVIGFAQLMRTDAGQRLDPRQLERVRHIERAGSHLLALVNDVLDLSRIDSGDMAVSTEPVELGPIAEESATLVSPLVTRNGVEVYVSPPHAGVWVHADPVRLRQVLVNLLSNAVKYNRPGGRVTLTWASDGGRCTVAVADDGPGIRAAQLERLFEPFNRLGAEQSAIEGTGIGLVLSRRLTEMMGGELQVSSRVGEGTVARVVLRRARPVARGAEAPLRPAVRPVHAGALDVLYAEDNEVNAELVRQVLGMRPAIALRVAEDGRSALAMARSRPPDVMLVDMNLGDMTGIELARALRGSSRTSGITLIALSADALPEQIDSALRHGFQNYLTKPLDFQKLLDLLDESVRA